MRRIRQVSAVVMRGGAVLIYAVCEDGTLWVKRGTMEGDTKWVQCTPIPEEEERQ